MILSVYKHFRAKTVDGGITTVHEAARQTAEAVGASYTTVLQVKADYRNGKGLETPRKHRGTERKVTRLQKYDSFTQAAIRRKVHMLYRENDLPTLNKVVSIVNEDDDLPTFSKTTMRRLLLDIGFKYIKRKRESLLIDREDIVAWRHRYLRSIRDERAKGKTIVYTDETWANAGHTKSRVWVDTSIKTATQAWREGLTSGSKAPSGKGGRVLLIHAGTECGFVEGAELIFVGKKTGDYHGEMDGERYEEYFTKQLLPNIPPNSVIVLDNASYHSVKIERVPTKCATKRVIQDWLTEKNIPWEPSMNKLELVELLNKVRANYDANYRIDNLAAAEGHHVLRLPPYHCELNPIELVWSQVKGYIAANNKRYKLPEVQQLMREGIRKVTPEQWRNYVEHVKQTENHMWEADGLIERLHDKIVINLNDDDSSSSSDDPSCADPDSDSDLGVQPLDAD